MCKNFIPFFLLIFILGATAVNAQHSLVKLWETDTVFKVPESVLYHAKANVLYVTNIDGKEPWGKDGKGSVGKLKIDGTVIAAEWVTGLNAPKGMGIFGNTLYVADLSELVMIDITKGSISKRISLPGATGLNDVSVDGKGNVYVSDMKEKKLFKVTGEKAIVIAAGLQNPNGVLVIKNEILVLDNGTLNRVNTDQSVSQLINGLESSTDGIEKVSGNEYLVSCWSGVVYYVNSATGTKEVLLDSRNEKINSADIGYNTAKKIVYIPTFWKNTVAAYTLK
jgi:sugar lactone lactonase YvrE